MADSPVSIINIGLLELGEDIIVSIDDPTSRARLAKLQYDVQRKQLLRSYRWSFATKRAILAPDADVPAFGFNYQFTLPPDLLRLIGVYDQNSADYQVNYTGSDIVYKVENGRKLLCDTNPLYIFYTGDVENTVDMDALFSVALSYAIASALAIPLTNDTAKLNIVEAKLARALKNAKAMSAIENTPEVLIASDWLDSRFQGAYGPRNSLIGV